tara:strand:- start:21 stop:203 length:183 start_codon:yes stop_codon:yes gene_type:complete
MIKFNSAKYLYDLEGVNKTHIQLNLGNNRYRHILIDPNNESYLEMLEWAKIDGNKIEEAD